MIKIISKLLSILLALIFMAACQLASTPTPAPASGVEGHVTIGPTCPVQQANNPCEDKSFQATLTVLNPQGKKVTQVQTDANGDYHLPLKPGEYVMHPESPNVMPHAAEQPFTVLDGQFTTLDITYDSGIR